MLPQKRGARARIATSALSPYLAPEPDGATVTYRGKGGHAVDWGTARAASPLLRKRTPYFEVAVVHARFVLAHAMYWRFVRLVRYVTLLRALRAPPLVCFVVSMPLARCATDHRLPVPLFHLQWRRIDHDRPRCSGPPSYGAGGRVRRVDRRAG